MNKVPVEIEKIKNEIKHLQDDIVDTESKQKVVLELYSKINSEIYKAKSLLKHKHIELNNLEFKIRDEKFKKLKGKINFQLTSVGTNDIVDIPFFTSDSIYDLSDNILIKIGNFVEDHILYNSFECVVVTTEGDIIDINKAVRLYGL